MRKLIYFFLPLILGIVIASCEKDDSSVIDPILTFPSITSNYITPTVLNSDTVNCIAGATVQSEEPLASVTVKFYDLGNNVDIQVDLKDDGVYPDTTAGDNKYTGIVFYNYFCRQVGSHKVEFLATNVSGLSSAPIQENVNVIRIPNQPPVVSGIFITPDSTQANVNAFFGFLINATDPNGACDIAKVFYIGFRPNGIQLNTSLELFDDGSCCIIPGSGVTSGDTTANDNKFTRLTAGAPPETGYYRYYIRAVDRSGDTSNVLADSIYVY